MTLPSNCNVGSVRCDDFETYTGGRVADQPDWGDASAGDSPAIINVGGDWRYRPARGATFGGAWWSASAFAADHYSQAEIEQTSGGQRIGILVRGAASQAYALMREINTLRLYHWNGSVLTQMASGGASLSTPMYMRLEVRVDAADDALLVFEGSSPDGPWTQATGLTPGDGLRVNADAGLAVFTGGAPGVSSYGSASSGTNADDWAGGDLVVAAGPSIVIPRRYYGQLLKGA